MKINFKKLVRPTLIVFGVGAVGFIAYAVGKELLLMEELLELAQAS